MSTPAALRVAEYHAVSFRRLWRATIGTAFFAPLFYLAGMGLGLGSLIDQSASSSASLDGHSYVAFLAPGLLAANGMIIGSLDSTWPVLGAMRWNRTFYAMTSTPLRAADLVAGHVLWMTFRVFVSVGAFATVMMLFKDTRNLGTVAAVPGGVLTGLAFAAPTFAWACTVDDNGGKFASFQRFVIVPMFLFSGTFFSVSLLPVVAAGRGLVHAPLPRGEPVPRPGPRWRAGLADGRARHVPGRPRGRRRPRRPPHPRPPDLRVRSPRWP